MTTVDELKGAAALAAEQCNKAARLHYMAAFDYHRGLFDGCALAIKLLTGEVISR